MPAPDELHVVANRSKEAASALAGPPTLAAKRLRELIAEIRLGREQVCIRLNPAALKALLGVSITNEVIELKIAARLKRTGHVMRLIQRKGITAEPNIDRTLVKAIVQGRSWWRELQANTDLTIEDLAKREGITAAYVVRIVRLAFVSPTMMKCIIDGARPAHLTVKRLCAPDAMSPRWDRQVA
jgi:hypothetical protein